MCIDPHQTGFLGRPKGSDRLQMIKFWPPAPREGVCGGAKFFWLRLTTASARCLRLVWAVFSFEAVSLLSVWFLPFYRHSTSHILMLKNAPLCTKMYDFQVTVQKISGEWAQSASQARPLERGNPLPTHILTPTARRSSGLRRSSAHFQVASDAPILIWRINQGPCTNLTRARRAIFVRRCIVSRQKSPVWIRKSADFYRAIFSADKMFSYVIQNIFRRPIESCCD